MSGDIELDPAPNSGSVFDIIHLNTKYQKQDLGIRSNCARV